MFLSVASELGFLGLALFSGVLFLAFKAALPISQRFVPGQGVFFGLVAYTIAGFSLTWEFQRSGCVLFGSVLSLKLRRSGQYLLAGGRGDRR
jgi:hypothetical protein